jgi:cytochrome c553
MRHLFASLSIAALVVAAWSGPGRAAATDAGAAGPDAGAKVVGPPEVAWKDLTKEQKGRYMKAVVVPKMKVVFQEFNPKLFKDFGCATCHGKEAKAREFKMPNPEIHPLPGTPEKFMAMMKKKPSWERWTKFMGGDVEPTMAGLLGKPVFDPKKPEPGAFGCAGCHTIDKK